MSDESDCVKVSSTVQLSLLVTRTLLLSLMLVLLKTAICVLYPIPQSNFLKCFHFGLPRLLFKPGHDCNFIFKFNVHLYGHTTSLSKLKIQRSNDFVSLICENAGHRREHRLEPHLQQLRLRQEPTSSTGERGIQRQHHPQAEARFRERRPLLQLQLVETKKAFERETLATNSSKSNKGI